MRNMFKTVTLTLGLAAAGITGAAMTAGSAEAAGGPGVPVVDKSWKHEGMFGTYDRAALQRGFQVFKDVCASCHSLNYIAFRNLVEIGFSEAEAKAIAAEFTVEDGPNDDGDMFERNAVLSDKFPAPFPNDKAAAASNNGVVPPDLSLMVKARPAVSNLLGTLRMTVFAELGAEDYLFSLLSEGYVDPIAEFSKPEYGYSQEALDALSATIGEDPVYNKFFHSTTVDVNGEAVTFPGGLISMAPPLSDEAVEYTDGTKATVEQMSSDVTQFLAWAAEPKLEERHSTGIRVILFLLVLIGLTYGSYKAIWADVKH